MAWAVSTIKDSLLGWLSAGRGASDGDSGLESARKAMIELVLYEACASDEEQQLRLLQRLRYASDLDALWYLRPELVGLLAQQMGEKRAHTCVQELAGLFGKRGSVRSTPWSVGR